MLISAEELRTQLANNRLRIALVGMSNSGKSTCTEMLKREMGFTSFEVDESINRELKIDSMQKAAEWMGYPFDPKYEANKQTYLDLEARFSKVSIPYDQNFVLDTTGSIIYAEQAIQNWIQSNFLVIGLRVAEALCQTLIKDYFEHPKTVIWGDEFTPRTGESGIEALKRCYPELLKNRAALYSELADVEVEAERIRDQQFNAELFFEMVVSELG